MLIVAYTLYKTPLDDEYKNVYDNYTSISDYHTFLTTYAEHTEQRTVDYPNQRSVKSINGDIVIPIDGLRADEIISNGYNYVEVLYQKSSSSASQPVYYFIQKVESLNDHWKDSDTGKNACKLFLKYDAWTNNYLDSIKDSTHQQSVNRATISHRYTSTNNNICLKTDIIELKHTYENVQLKNIIGYGILSLGVSLSKEAVIRRGGTDVNTIPAQNYAPVVYIPLVNVNLTGIGPFLLKDSYGETIPIDGTGMDYSIPDYLNDARVLNIWLTYYGVSASSVLSPDSTYPLLDGQSIVEVTLSTGDVPFKAISAPHYNFGTQISVYNTVDDAGSNISGYEMLKEYSEELNLYPFKGKGLLIGNSILPLKYAGAQYVGVNISRDNSTTANITIECPGMYKTRTQLLDSLAFPVGKYVDSLELYYMNNQNQIGVKTAKSISNMAFGAVSGVIGGYAFGPIGAMGGMQSLTSGMFDYAMLNAQAADIDNALDNYSIPSFIGSDSVYIDGVFVVDCEINDENLKRQFFYDSHCNGIRVADSMTAGQVNKELFDYMRTNGCNLPDIPILVHRREIEKAFDRGIRKFHITATNKQAAFNCEAEYANNSI